MGARSASRIPRRIQILGHRIGIRLVSATALAQAAADDRPLDGLWEDETSTIYVHNRLSKRDRRLTILHELQHALIDITEWEKQSSGQGSS